MSDERMETKTDEDAPTKESTLLFCKDEGSNIQNEKTWSS